MVPTFQYPHHRSQPPVLSANSLHCSAAHCAKMLSPYDRFIRGKRWKSQGAKSRQMMVDDQTLPIENASVASLLQLQYVAEHCHEEGQYLDNIPHLLFWIKESNYSTQSTFSGRLYCFRHVYGLTMRTELTSAICRNRQAYYRRCATHLRKASSDSCCGSNFATDRNLKKRNSFRVIFL